jgi:anti-sigma B factor antagonist
MADKKLTYSLDPRGAALVVHWQGFASFEENATIERCFKEVRAQGAKVVILDLARVEYIGSAALGALIALHKSLAAAQGQLRLAGLQPLVKEVFTLSALEKVFRFDPDVDRALAGTIAGNGVG